MTYTTIYYLGPKQTFSYTAAQRIQTAYDQWANTALVPCRSAAEIFRQVQNDRQGGAVVPVFNLEQGVVHDFTRFYLFHAVAEEKLQIEFALFSQAKSLADVHKLVTKDTVIPQISHWIADLPPHINIEATPYISTAASARRAAFEPNTAAICSPDAGACYPQLNRLASKLSNNPDSYTQFKLFVRPEHYWHNINMFPLPEYPYRFTDQLAERVRAGDCCITWAKSTRSALHLGHYSNLLTLQKLAYWGNHIDIVFDVPSAETTALQKEIDHILGRGISRKYHIGRKEVFESTADVIVSGIEHIHTYAGTTRPIIFVDNLPGIDGYAQMTTDRGNMILGAAVANVSNLPAVFADHFTEARYQSVN